MKFSDFICRDAIRTHLEADEKETVIRAMGTALVEAGKISQDNYESIIAAILKREELGSTGIGRGVAVPHTKHPAVDKLVGTVAISEEGVDFDSLDGEKVHLLFLLISPPDRPGDHLAGSGKHLASAARRHVLPFPQAEQNAGRCLAAFGRRGQQSGEHLKDRDDMIRSAAEIAKPLNRRRSKCSSV